MTARLGKNRVLVLSDNDRLSRAIEFNLGRHLDVMRLPLCLPGQRMNPVETENFDLVVVAMSSPTNDPFAILTRTSLSQQIGQIPMVIISGRSFRTKSGDRIVHMDFPFDIGELYSQVTRILRETPKEDSGKYPVLTLEGVAKKTEMLNSTVVEQTHRAIEAEIVERERQAEYWVG